MKTQREAKATREPIAPTILRPREACRYLAISRTALHNLHEKDPTFPRKIRFSIRCVGWRKDSLDDWLNQKEQNGY